jgi:quercetin dioxygenase-like cupin family protein
MPWEESRVWWRGSLTTDYYQELVRSAHGWPHRERRRQVIKPQDMPWEITPHGIVKWLANERMDVAVSTLDAYMLVIPPGSRSGKQRHLAEEYVYVIEGSGYDEHVDCDFDITEQGYNLQCPEEVKRFQWRSGDVIYIPPNTIHQHFNTSSSKPARLIVAMSRLYRWAGLNDLQELEPSPEYQEAKSLPPEKVRDYISRKLALA